MTNHQGWRASAYLGRFDYKTGTIASDRYDSDRYDEVRFDENFD
jgi:hypothetical protein